jgi:hypothetical protein
LCTLFNTDSSATPQIPLYHLRLEINDKLVKIYFCQSQDKEDRTRRKGRGVKDSEKRTRREDEKERTKRQERGEKDEEERTRRKDEEKGRGKKGEK